MEKNNKEINNLFSPEHLSQLNENTSPNINNEHLKQKLRKAVIDMRASTSLLNRRIEQLKDKSERGNIVFRVFMRQKDRYNANVQQTILYTDDILDNLSSTEKEKLESYISNVVNKKSILEETYKEYKELATSYQIDYISAQTQEIISNLSELDRVKNQVALSQSLLDETDAKIKNTTGDMKEVKEEVKRMSNDFQNLGFTIIGIIVSFTIVSTAIAGIVNMDKTYLPLYLSFVVWMGMTLIAFASCLFTKDKFNRNSKIIYGIFTLITFIILLCTVYFF